MSPWSKIIGMTCAILFTSASIAEEQQKTVTIDEIFAAIKTAPKIKSLESEIQHWGDAMAEEHSSTFGATKLELEADKAKEGDDRSAGIKVTQPLVFGNSSDSAKAKSRAEVKARISEMQDSLLDKMNLAGEAFVGVLKSQRVIQFIESLSKKIEPLSRSASGARSQGSISTLSSLKWTILTKRIQSALASEKRSQTLLMEALQQLSPLKFKGVTLSDIKAVSYEVEGHLAHPKMVAMKSKLESLEHESDMAGAYEIEPGIGLSRDLNLKNDTYTVSLAIPIGQGFVSSSRKKSLSSERQALSGEIELAKSIHHQEGAYLAGEAKSLTEKVAAQENLVKEIDGLLDKVLNGLKQGSADFSEAVEAIESEFEAHMDLIEEKSELDRKLINLRLLNGGIQ
jgi:hypothetical protein